MTELENGDRVLHPEHGTGDIRRILDQSVAEVYFDRSKRTTVMLEDLEKAPVLLRDVDVKEKPEWADEPTDGEDPLYGGEVELNLDFHDDVEYDVDVGSDGNIIIQYWRDNNE